MLISRIHNGKTNGAQLTEPRLKRRNNARIKPRNIIQRGKIRVRKDSVQVVSINTPAIFRVYTFMIS